MRIWYLAILTAMMAVFASGCSDDCTPTAEICDSLDNDCNGLVDDGLQRVCNTDCGSGVEVCEAGAWVKCSAPEPGVEVCNGKDDDCDGCFDEKPGAECAPLEQPCSTDCGSGIEYCYMGGWQDCTAKEPLAETCNGLDDDCDGSTDEDLDTDADSDGHYSLESCSTPNDDCDDSDAEKYPGHAEDCDGQDNDCDQMIDEGCTCTAPDSQPCGSDVGICTVGQHECQQDGTWGPCLDADNHEVVLAGAQTEICDDLDNDCDGDTDEGNPEGGGQCGTDEGVCQTGISVCQNGNLECQGGVEPGEEICNDPAAGPLDDDCDGLTDEGLDSDNWESNDSCSMARAISPLDDDQNNILLVTKTLYRFENDQFQKDVDWFCANAVESSSSFCVPGDPQCMLLTVRLDLPPGADHTRWKACLYDHGASSDSNSCTENCGSELVILCTDPDVDWNGSFYQMAVQWQGACAASDSRFLAVEVTSAADDDIISQCQPYILTLGVDKLNEACQ